METEVAGWTIEEQSLAQAVFDCAKARDVESLIVDLRSRSLSLGSPEEVWQFHDDLSIRRHEIEGRFDFRLSGLLFVFASFVKDGLVSLEELEGLSADKLAKIGAMSRM
jgi:Photoprotection regulator fluorescence recovery protein